MLVLKAVIAAFVTMLVLVTLAALAGTVGPLEFFLTCAIGLGVGIGVWVSGRRHVAVK